MLLYLYHLRKTASYILSTKRDKREAFHRRYFQVLVSLAFLRGKISQVHDFGAVALWLPPNATLHSNLLHMFRAGYIGFFRNMGFGGFRRFFVDYYPRCEKIKKQLLGNRTKAYYISCVGVHPSVGKKDLISPLLENILRQAYEGEQPCFAECIEPSHLDTYFGLGFHIHHSMSLNKQQHGAMVWFLKREPYAYHRGVRRSGLVVPYPDSNNTYYYSPASIKRCSTLMTGKEGASDQSSLTAILDAPQNRLLSKVPLDVEPQLKKGNSIFTLKTFKPWKRSRNYAKSQSIPHSTHASAMTNFVLPLPVNTMGRTSLGTLPGHPPTHMSLEYSFASKCPTGSYPFAAIAAGTHNSSDYTASDYKPCSDTQLHNSLHHRITSHSNFTTRTEAPKSAPMGPCKATNTPTNQPRPLGHPLEFSFASTSDQSINSQLDSMTSLSSLDQPPSGPLPPIPDQVGPR
ncbi:hypothetical protein IWQ61_006516 [Dispira simplex]|nr:hypothetical protein IWQ61_006516 [Dispira simplex]